MSRPTPPLSPAPIAGGPSELDLVRELNYRGVPGLTLAEFTVAAWHVVEPARALVWNWHMDALCEHIGAQLERGRFGKPWAQNLLINIPPGTTKSLITCVMAPAWVWSWDGGARKSLYTSANPDVALRDSTKTRDLVASAWYQSTFRPRWQLSGEQNAKGYFLTTAGGFRQAKGVGAAITGNRADDIVIDDPLDASEAHSKLAQDSVNVNWYDQAVANRLNDMQTGCRTIVMQRLAENDLAGHVLAEGNFEHLKIPMEYEASNPCKCPSCLRGVSFLGWKDPRTKEGQLLFPERFPLSVLKGPAWPAETGGELRRLGSAAYAGQHQQWPTSVEGNFFKPEWWRFWARYEQQSPRPQGATQAPPRVVPHKTRFDAVIMSWDLAFKALDHSDYVCGLVIGKIGADRYVLDARWEQLDFTQTCDAIVAMRKAWPAARVCLVEDAANGPAVINTLSRKVSGLIAVKPEGGKQARAAACSPAVEAGNVYLPEGAAFLDRWFAEFSAFPLGKHDDCVDALSQGLLRLEGTEDVFRAAALLGQR